MNLLKTRCISAKTAIIALCLGFSFSLGFAQIQKVRLDYQSPSGAIRQILIGFTPNNEASDGVDYGYDSAAWNYYDFDMNWMIGEHRYIIQGVGTFHETKTYPIGLFLAETSEVNISLHSLENFEEDINVYIYDAENDTYHHINENAFSEIIDGGNYMSRFYIAFFNPYSNQNTLSTENFELLSDDLRYVSNSKTLKLKSRSASIIKELSIYSIDGRKIYTKKGLNSKDISLEHIHFQKSVYIVRVSTSNGKLSKIIYI